MVLTHMTTGKRLRRPSLMTNPAFNAEHRSCFGIDQ